MDHTIRRRALGLTALLGAFSFLSLGSALRESPTYDEPIHVAAGYLFWKSHHYTLEPGHPPLIRLWATIPLLIKNLPVPNPELFKFANGHWMFTYLFTNRNRISVDRLIDGPRVMIILLGLALGFLIWLWALQLWGEPAAWAALVAYAFNPAMLAFSHLVTTDFGACFMSTLALYIGWRSRRLNLKMHGFLIGCALGLATMAKFSEILLVGILGSVLLVEIVRDKKRSFSMALISWQLTGAAVGFSWVVLLVYQGTQWSAGLRGFQMMFSLQQYNTMPHFFMNTIQQGSPWWFVTATFLLKTPVAFLIWMGIGISKAIKKELPNLESALLWLVWPCVFYVGFVSVSRYQLGLRRILFVYPLLCVVIGGTAASLMRDEPCRRCVAVALATWYVLGSVFSFPFYLSYFNEAAGGPSQGYRYLLDCNWDWGQGLKELGRYLKKSGIQTIYLSYFGAADPTSYGIDYIPVANVSNFPLDGLGKTSLTGEKKILFAISGTNRGGVYFKDHHLFQWLDNERPLALVGNSIWIYDFTNRPDLLDHLERLRRRPSGASDARLSP